MRVTKFIREYVENEISDKFDSKWKAVEREHRKKVAELDNRLNALRQETEEKACEIARSMGFEYRNEYVKNRAVIIGSNSFAIEEEEAKIDSTRRELLQKKRKAIENILLNLELGETSKAELKSEIDSIEI